MSVVEEVDIRNVLEEKLGNKDVVDDDLMEYLTAMLVENDDVDQVPDLLHPFLESSGCSEALMDETTQAVQSLYKSSSGVSSSAATMVEVTKLKQGMSMKQKDKDEAEEDANRFLWGTPSGGVTYNVQKDAESSTISAKERRKQRQELEKVRKQLLAQNQQQDEDDDQQVSVMVLPDFTNTSKRDKDLHVWNCSLSLDNGRKLLDSADLKLSYGRRYGLIGKNGIGKTTLLRAIANHTLSHDFPKHFRILHVRQEVRMTSSSDGEPQSVTQTVLNSHVERNALLQKEKDLLAQLELQQDTTTTTITTEELLKNKKQNDTDAAGGGEFNAQLKELEGVYARLQLLGSNNAESRASTILGGLQFTAEMQAGPLTSLSGGWRMRVSLACALFMEPDVLMLDEPTNHLDLEAVLWLESYLNHYPHTVLVVSHDRQFLNEVCTDTIEFASQALKYYKGNYDTYVKTRDELLKNQIRVYESYQEKRQHLMDFIIKFRANAKRATLVQSRMKTVEKMDAEAPPPVEVEAEWTFTIPSPDPNLGRPIIAVHDVTFDYTMTDTKGGKQKYLLNDVNFGVDLDTRLGILGPNGAGKSTLLNLMIGLEQRKPISGNVVRNPHLRLGHFTQHSSDKFDLNLSPVENLLQIFHSSESSGGGDVLQIRQFLGKFQIQGNDAMKPMSLLSGGQKSRVAFATLAYQRPHVIILDEPTNHLDMESIDALIGALQNFKGGIVVVSHDQYFITQTCTHLTVVHDGTATPLDGTFEQYKEETLKRTAKRVAESVHTLSNLNK